MARLNRFTVYVNDQTPYEIRSPKKGERRTYVNFLNGGPGAIYIDFDVQATPENGFTIGGSSSRQWGDAGQASLGGVPQGNIWILGTTVAPAFQKVVIEEGFA